MINNQASQVGISSKPYSEVIVSAGYSMIRNVNTKPDWTRIMSRKEDNKLIFQSLAGIFTVRMLWLLAFDVSLGHQLPLKYLHNIQLTPRKVSNDQGGGTTVAAIKEA